MIKRIVLYVGNPANTSTLKKLGYIALAVVFLVDFLVHREHAIYLWDTQINDLKRALGI